MKKTQKIATNIFITASVLFGLMGLFVMLSNGGEQDPPIWEMRTLGSLVFIILSSFGVSVGLKYLGSNGKR